MRKNTLALFAVIATFSNLAVAQIIPNYGFEGWYAKNKLLAKNWTLTGTVSQAPGNNVGTALRLQNNALKGTISTAAQAKNDTGFFYDPSFAFNGTPDSITIVYKASLGLDTAYILVGFEKSGEPQPLVLQQLELTGNAGIWQSITLPLLYQNDTAGLAADSGFIFIYSADELNGPYSNGFIDIDAITFKKGTSTASNIPNHSFDNWDVFTVEYADNWSTNADLLDQLGLISTYSAKSTDKNSGNYAIKLEGFTVQDIQNGGTDTFPGLAVTSSGKNGALGGIEKAAFAVNKRFQSVRGRYKSNVTEMDKISVWVNFFHADSVVGTAVYSDAVSRNSYFEFVENITWDSSYLGLPDSATVQLMLSDTLFTKVGSLSSWALFDEISFDNYPANTDNVGLISDVSIFPNPVKDKLNIAFRTNFNNSVYLNLFGSDGREYKSIRLITTIGNNQAEMDLSGLSPGVYFIECRSNNIIFNKKIVYNP